ncbi:MAG TPA: hypothetical protein ENH23_01130, partial [candidate division Zixibacteria bacterium]|nr:hypothetical protein [candidate division Zixibacteria bacterium]
MSRNPYTLDDAPKVKESICAFFDILGFKEKVNSAKNLDISNERLKHFHSSLRVSANFLENKKYELVTEDGISVIKEKDAYINDYSLRIFSDCFVIGYPLKDYNKIGWQGGKEIFTIMEKLSQFQLRMSLCGYLLRGAITIGELYMDNDI